MEKDIDYFRTINNTQLDLLLEEREAYHEGFIIDIIESNSLICGEITPLRRLFVRSKRTSETSDDIGWVLFDDVDRCMTCGHQFGVWKSKIHCYACGNVVCSSCCNMEAAIEACDQPRPGCLLCYWGQETVEVQPTPKKGLPVYISDITLLGQACVTHADSKLIIRARSKMDYRLVRVNLCVSPLIPERAELSKFGLISMVFGPSSTSSDGVDVYTVVVNPDELQTRRMTSVVDAAVDKGGRDDGGVVELCTQALSLVARVTGQPLSTIFRVDTSSTYYYPDKTIAENERHANANADMLTLGLPQTEDTSQKGRRHPEVQVEIAVPGPTAFKIFTQLPITLTQGQKISSVKTHHNDDSSVTSDNDKKKLNQASIMQSRRGNTIVRQFKEKYSGSVAITRDSSSVSGSVSGAPSYDKVKNEMKLNRLNAMPRGLIREQSAISDIESQDSKAFSVFNQTLSLVVVGEQKKIVVQNSMMECQREEMVNASAAAKIKRNSIKQPAILVGWLILIMDEKGINSGKGIITGLRKKILRTTEFRISTPEAEDRWVRLQREEKMPGLRFQLMRKIDLPIQA